MRMEELEAVVRAGAAELVARQPGTFPPAVVLPLPESTKVTSFPDFPDDDRERFDLIARFAGEVVLAANAPAYGFVGEAVLDVDGAPVDVVVVVCGARRRRAVVAAAPREGDGLGEFGPSEELDPTAMPFLAPLQHAVDGAQPPEGAGPPLPVVIV